MSCLASRASNRVKGIEMKSVTGMSDEAINATVRAGNVTYGAGEYKFQAEMNASDFGMMILALRAAYEHTADGGCAGLAEIDAREEVADWAYQWCSDMAAGVGIEFV